MPALLPDGVDVHHVRTRLQLLRRPNVIITAPPSDVKFDYDVAIPARDGTILRANVFRPPSAEPRPAILCAHPYGKDGLPKLKGSGRRTRFSIPFQLRMLSQSTPVKISAWTGWEAPDPVFWVQQGYTLVNCDLRGWGHSDGVGELLSAQEGRDVHDVVEWIAAQPWCTGKVGMLGVSYLAISQWATAAERPPHLAAICPWEGFIDAYRDFMRQGGVRENGFLRLWEMALKSQRRSPVHMLRDSKRHPLFDGYWENHNRHIERIDVPVLVCGSFSDHNLHSRGSFEGFRRIESTDKWLYTHRGPKWATFYADDARAQQRRFFDHFLAGLDNGWSDEPRVRLEVREDASTITAVRGESAWPPDGTTWEPRFLAPDGRLTSSAPAEAARVRFDLRRGRATFTYRFAEDAKVIGPMWARVHVELEGPDDACVFVGVRKVRSGKVVGFEGSYGFDRALVTCGMLKVAQRAVDPTRSLPWAPFHPHTTRALVRADEIVALDIELSPQATLFRAGEELRFDIQGRWFFPSNPLTGQMPAHYERSRKGTCVLHLGGRYDAALFVPVRRSDEPT